MHSYRLRHLVFGAALLAAAWITSAPVMAAPLDIPMPSAYADSHQITFCANFTNPPREFYEDGEPAGADVDLALAMADRIGLDVKWLQVKFAGLITALQAGQCDMIVGELFMKPERMEVIQFVPFSTSGQQIVVPTGNSENIETLKDLAGLKVAVPNGTTFLERIQNYNDQAKKNGDTPIRELVVPSTRDMMHQVAIGMADAGGATTTSAAYYLRKTEGRLELAGDSFGRIRDGFGIRKDDDELQAAMSKAFEAVRADGTYQQIFDEYQLGSAMLD